MKVIVPVSVGFPPGALKEFHAIIEMSADQFDEFNSNLATYPECQFGTVVGQKVLITELPDEIQAAIDEQVHAIIFGNCTVSLGPMEVDLSVGDRHTRLSYKPDTDKFEEAVYDWLQDFMMGKLVVDHEYAIVTKAIDFAF